MVCTIKKIPDLSPPCTVWKCYLRNSETYRLSIIISTLFKPFKNFVYLNYCNKIELIQFILIH